MSSTSSIERSGEAAALAYEYGVTLEHVITEAYRALEWLMLSGMETDGYTIVIVDDKAYLDQRLLGEVRIRLDHQKLVREKKERATT